MSPSHLPVEKPCAVCSAYSGGCGRSSIQIVRSVPHGVLFYAILSVAGKSVPVGARLVAAVALESGWEILENTNTIIERYRAQTVSLNYYGDSIINSMADIVACMFGFIMASRLPKRVTIIGVVVFEIVLALWIRDNLALNIIMLLNPSRTIRLWQLR